MYNISYTQLEIPILSSQVFNVINFSTNRMPKLARVYMCSILIAVDFLSILISFAVATVFWNSIKKDIVFSQYFILIPFFLLFIIAFMMMDLYPGIGQSPITQFRSIYIATTVIFLVLGALSFVVKVMNVYSRGIFLISWILCLLFIPTIRNWIIRILSKNNLWGDPVIIVGLNDRTTELVQMLITHPEYGFIPTLILSFTAHKGDNQSLFDIPILKITKEFVVTDLGQLTNVLTAIVIPSDIDQKLVNHFLQEGNFYFSRIVMVPEKTLGSLWVTPFDIGGVLGFEIKQNLLSTSHRIIKRFLDLFIIIVTSPFVFLLGIIIAIAIKLDSRGSVFYRENRIGHNGDSFSVYKFRTMVSDANEQLEKYLKTNPQLADEWEQSHKLKNDPRITKVGRLLRRLSLDELPQLINILGNEMSLVGPRPIVQDEICKYGDRFELYKKVKPGLSGLWQVSGRNDISYEARVNLDEYYVRNYSIWMDIYIIRKTVDAVLSNKGAY